jgi:hypothetical protein
MAKPRRKFMVLPSLGVSVQIEADEIQFAGACMIFWRDGACIAQFSQWLGWFEIFENADSKASEPASVTTLKLVKNTLEDEGPKPLPPVA